MSSSIGLLLIYSISILLHLLPFMSISTSYPLSTSSPSPSIVEYDNTMIRRGCFFLFEGLDRCGKSTQSKLLADYLATTPTTTATTIPTTTTTTEHIRFPDRTTAIGGLINNYLQSSQDLSDQAIHLLFSANRWESSLSMEKKLLEGVNLVCDRYAYSGVAYSNAKGMDLTWCKNCDRGLLAPDCVIYLDISVEDATKRGQYGEERYEKADFQRKVRDAFMKLREMDDSTEDIPWFVLDATKSVEELQREIQDIAKIVHTKASNKPLARLWTKA
eukprot:gene5031-5524_t